MLKIGVIGAGHLGKIHLKCLLDLRDHYHLVGLFDIDPEVAKATSQQFDIQAFSSYEALLGAVDVVDIVAPTVTHFGLAKTAIERGKRFHPFRNARLFPQSDQIVVIGDQHRRFRFGKGHV